MSNTNVLPEAILSGNPQPTPPPGAAASDSTQTMPAPTPVSAPAAGTNALSTPAAPVMPPAPPRGSMSESMGAQLQRLGVAQRYGKALDMAAAANPKPSAPGSWARNILAAVPSVLSGVQNTMENIGAAESAPIPMGASGLAVGAARAAAAQRQRTNQATDEEVKQQHAAAQAQIDKMHVVQAQRLMAKNDPKQTVLDDAITHDKDIIDAQEEAARMSPAGSNIQLATGLTHDQVAQKYAQAAAANDPKDPWRPTNNAYYASGKKVVPGATDQYGNPVYEQTYTVLQKGGPQFLDPKSDAAKNLVQRFKDAGLRKTDGSPIELGDSIPWDGFVSLASQLDQRETANNLLEQQREKFGLEKMTYEQTAQNQQLITEFNQAFAKAEQAHKDITPEDGRIMAYQQLIATHPEQAEAIGSLFFGGAKDAQKAVQDWRNKHDLAFLEPLYKDATDPIASQIELSKQTVVDPKTGQAVPTPAALAARRILAQYTPTEMINYQKELIAQKNAAVKKTQNMDFTGDPNATTTEGYLQSLSPDARSVVELVGTGKAPLTRNDYILARNPQLMAAVSRAYPDFDGSKVASYPKVYQDFTSGKTSVALNSGETAIKHLRDLWKINKENPIEVHEGTTVGKLGGSKAYQAYNNLKGTVVGELAQFYQLGKTDKQIEEMKDGFDATVNRGAAIQRQIASLEEKLKSYEQQWKSAAPSPAYQAPMPSIDEGAKQALAEMDPQFVKDNPEFAPQSAQPANQTPANPASVLPPVKTGQTRLFSPDRKTHYDIPDAQVGAFVQKYPALVR